VSAVRLTDLIEIKIRDNGMGIPDAVKEKIFTLFFTTKPVGKGSGLGLALSRDIVTVMHKGHLSVVSEPGNFTEFTIQLPLNL
jgi:signal transduction histidine kinase